MVNEPKTNKRPNYPQSRETFRIIKTVIELRKMSELYKKDDINDLQEYVNLIRKTFALPFYWDGWIKMMVSGHKFDYRTLASLTNVTPCDFGGEQIFSISVYPDTSLDDVRRAYLRVLKFYKGRYKTADDIIKKNQRKEAQMAIFDDPITRAPFYTILVFPRSGRASIVNAFKAINKNYVKFFSKSRKFTTCRYTEAEVSAALWHEKFSYNTISSMLKNKFDLSISKSAVSSFVHRGKMKLATIGVKL